MKGIYITSSSPFPANALQPQNLAGLFISKVIVTSLERLLIGLKDLIVRKSSHVFELDALSFLISSSHIIFLLSLLLFLFCY